MFRITLSFLSIARLNFRFPVNISDFFERYPKISDSSDSDIFTCSNLNLIASNGLG